MDSSKAHGGEGTHRWFLWRQRVRPECGGAAGVASSPATACSGAVVRSLLGARAASLERRAREKREKWHL